MPPVEFIEECRCNEDGMRLIKLLLSDLTLKIKSQKTESDSFTVNLGFFQGDSLSAKIFNHYISGALNHLRATTNLPAPPIHENLMPSDTAYADDCDFYGENEKDLLNLLPNMGKVFKEWCTDFYLSVYLTILYPR